MVFNAFRLTVLSTVFIAGYFVYFSEPGQKLLRRAPTSMNPLFLMYYNLSFTRHSTYIFYLPPHFHLTQSRNNEPLHHLQAIRPHRRRRTRTIHPWYPRRSSIKRSTSYFPRCYSVFIWECRVCVFFYIYIWCKWNRWSTLLQTAFNDGHVIGLRFQPSLDPRNLGTEELKKALAAQSAVVKVRVLSNSRILSEFTRNSFESTMGGLMIASLVL